MLTVIVLVQARMGSCRLPGKVLSPFCALPMLAYQVQRLQRARWKTHVLVPREDVALLALREHGVPVHRVAGDPVDVLGRYATYARLLLRPGAVIVRACGDSPLLCPFLLEMVLTQWRITPGLAYLGMGPGWPDGLGDYDVFTREALLAAQTIPQVVSAREHVAPAFWQHPERFPQAQVAAPAWVRARRWPKFSVDTPEDLAYVERVAQKVTTVWGADYLWSDVLATIEATPALQRAPQPMNQAYAAQVAQEQGTAVQSWDALRYNRQG